jgi:hypothetical protein
MISYDSIYFGYAPSYDPSVTMAALNKATGQKAATSVETEFKGVIGTYRGL